MPTIKHGAWQELGDTPQRRPLAVLDNDRRSRVVSKGLVNFSATHDTDTAMPKGNRKLWERKKASPKQTANAKPKLEAKGVVSGRLANIAISVTAFAVCVYDSMSFVVHTNRVKHMLRQLFPLKLANVREYFGLLL